MPRWLLLCFVLAFVYACGDASKDVAAEAPGAAAEAAAEPEIISGTVRQNAILRLAVTEAHFADGAANAPAGQRYYTIGLRGMSRSRNDVEIPVEPFVFGQNEQGCIARPLSEAPWLTRPFGAVAVFTANEFSDGQLAFAVPANTQQMRVLIAPADGNSLTVPAGPDFTPAWPAPLHTIEDGTTLRVLVLPQVAAPAGMQAAAGRELVLLDFVVENLQAAQGIEFTSSQQLRLIDTNGAFVQPSALTQQLGCRLDDGDVVPPGHSRRFQLVYEIPAGTPLRLQYRGFEVDEVSVDY